MSKRPAFAYAFSLVNNDTQRAFLGRTAAPAQKLYDIFRLARLHPSRPDPRWHPHALYDDIKLLGRDAFTWSVIPCKRTEILRVLADLRARYPLQYTRPKNTLSKNLTVKQRTIESKKSKNSRAFDELYESYLTVGETPEKARARAMEKLGIFPRA